ncbi:MAG: 30S ribosome-binding factor RbfA [Bdellovibrionales bacterium]|jgi:ribosome-binding factor A|nr:30S ribosome-binding factor RbfA [Bdellovibrionales bacterium]
MSSGSDSGHDLRVTRVERAIRDIVAGCVTKGLRDVPRGPVTITRVEATRDFKTAKVFVSIFLEDHLSEQEREDKVDRILFAFEDAQSELRRAMNSQMRIKNIPHLEFVLDKGVDKMVRMIELLKAVRPEGKGSGEEQ